MTEIGLYSLDETCPQSSHPSRGPLSSYRKRYRSPLPNHRLNLHFDSHQVRALLVCFLLEWRVVSGKAWDMEGGLFVKEKKTPHVETRDLVGD